MSHSRSEKNSIIITHSCFIILFHLILLIFWYYIHIMNCINYPMRVAQNSDTFFFLLLFLLMVIVMLNQCSFILQVQMLIHTTTTITMTNTITKTLLHLMHLIFIQLKLFPLLTLTQKSSIIKSLPLSPASVSQWYSKPQIKLRLLVRILPSVFNYHLSTFRGVNGRVCCCLVILTCLANSQC